MSGLFSGLLHKLGLEQQAAHIGLAIHVVAISAINQADAFDFGALLQRARRAFDFEVFHQNHRVAVLQQVAVGIAYHAIAGGFIAVRRRQLWPLVRTVRADVVVSVRVGVFKAALRAGGDGVWHGRLLSSSQC